MESKNTQELNFHDWRHHISQELKKMNSLMSSDVIKKFDYKQTPLDLNPPKVLNTDFKTLLNKNNERPKIDLSY